MLYSVLKYKKTTIQPERIDELLYTEQQRLTMHCSQ